MLGNHAMHDREAVKMTQECRRYFAGKEHAAVFTKCALIVTSPISKIIGNFFLGANKPIRPTKLFTDVNQGLNWLKD
jgi:predicted transcriptional regulator